MNAQQLAIAAGARIDRARKFLGALATVMAEFSITGKYRAAAFLANIGHESGGLRYTTELWGPTPAQVRYEGRKDLGNVFPGDGFKYRGRGLIQITGRDNFAHYGKLMLLDLVNQPELLAEPEHAARSAALYWDREQLNVYADKLDFDGICDEINRGRKTQAVGDSNGWAERYALYRAGLEVLE